MDIKCKFHHKLSPQVEVQKRKGRRRRKDIIIIIIKINRSSSFRLIPFLSITTSTFLNSIIVLIELTADISTERKAEVFHFRFVGSLLSFLY